MESTGPIFALGRLTLLFAAAGDLGQPIFRMPKL
jgi:hypothetical protein